MWHLWCYKDRIATDSSKAIRLYPPFTRCYESRDVDEAKETPDETGLSLKIPKQYKDYTEFTVVLIDRHGLKYGKVVTEVSPKGRTEVKITADDEIESKGDFWKKVNKWFNGD